MMLNQEGDTMTMCRLLRNLLESERPLIMPDAYDALSARLIEMAGFKAVQCSGFSMALASSVLPEPKLSFDEMLDITRRIVSAVKVPVMADGEDGFGGPDHVFEVTAAYAEAGVAGINIEDQILRVSETKTIVDCELMVEKLRAGREGAASQGADDLVLNARTDALATMPDRTAGLRESIRRGNRYLEVGADLIFVTGVKTAEEARELAREINGPLSVAAGLAYNINTLSIKDLRDCDIARISLPTIAVLSAVAAIRHTLSVVRESEDFTPLIQEGHVAGMDVLTEVLHA